MPGLHRYNNAVALDEGATSFEGRLVALIPAHNEAEGILVALEALAAQTRVPDRVIVIADNCDDDTAERARGWGAEVVVTVGNRSKKAGALNQVLATLLTTLLDGDVVLVQDADSFLDEGFIDGGLAALDHDPGLGAVGGTFRGKPAPPGSSWRERLLTHLQDNEYARYARDVRRLRGRCLVVTGTAAMSRAGTLREVSQARMTGRLPAGDGRGGVYDTSVLTEDNELSFAMMTLGRTILAPRGMTLTTEVMPTLRQLSSQRLRWTRGAVENCFQYGFTRVTAGYWGRQALTAVGILVTAVYLTTLVYALAVHAFHLSPFWASLTLVFVLERFVTLKDKGWKAQLTAASMYELPYDLFIQATQARAYAHALFRRTKNW
ncbi:MAG: glycosyltransferase family 2 protein [Dermatophilaceae bacterium]